MFNAAVEATFELDNSGDVRGVDYAIYSDALLNYLNYLENSGTIAGSIYLDPGSGGINDIVDTGTVSGGFLGVSGVTHVRNSGLWEGNVFFGADDDTFNGRGGTVTGNVSGGAGGQVSSTFAVAR